MFFEIDLRQADFTGLVSKVNIAVKIVSGVKCSAIPDTI